MIKEPLPAFWGLVKKHFKPSEFDSPDAPGSGRTMQKAFMLRLYMARVLAGVKFTITSGKRTVKHNKALKERGFMASVNSAHLKGQAGDIRTRTSRHRFWVLFGVVLVGFHRIGIAKTFIHVDDDKTKPREVAWVY